MSAFIIGCLIHAYNYDIKNHMTTVDKFAFTFIDVETTGMAAFYDDRVCEIGIARCDGLELVSTWSSLVNPERPISYGAMNVHGISNEMVETAPKFKDVADEILKLISGAVVVCHNAPFDLSFINAEFTKCGKTLPEFQVMDTLKIARRYFNFPSNSLGNIANSLHIDLENAHRALADAVATQKVFAHMMKDLEKRGLEDIEKLFVKDGKAPADSDSVSVTGRMIPMRTAELPPILDEALKKKAKVRVRYLSSAGVETERILTPKEIVFRQDSAYLSAYCDLRREDRTFRLDRIIEIQII